MLCFFVVNFDGCFAEFFPKLKDVIEMGMPLCLAGLYNRQLITEDAILISLDGRDDAQ